MAQQGARPYPSRPCPPPLPDQAEGCPFNRPHPVGSRGPEGTPPQSVGGDGLGSGPGAARLAARPCVGNRRNMAARP